MDDREKLIELIAEIWGDDLFFTDDERNKLADHLIANNMVIQEQGEWIEHIETLAWCEDDVDVFYKCSVCGTHSPDTSPFCPNCGAKMNEVK